MKVLQERPESKENHNRFCSNTEHSVRYVKITYFQQVYFRLNQFLPALFYYIKRNSNMTERERDTSFIRWKRDEKDEPRWTQLEMTSYFLLSLFFSRVSISLRQKSASWLFITDFTTPAFKHSLVCLSVRCVCTLSSLMLVLH